jgi:large subunit ribosomal protein L6
MSRIGKKPISIPGGATVELKGRHIKVSGRLGTLEMHIDPRIKVAVDESAKEVVLTNDRLNSAEHRQIHGTMRSLVANMVEGVTEGFAKKMEIYGTGYSLKEQGGKLVLQIGYCHPIELRIPKDVSVEIQTAATRGNEVPAVFTVKGPDKCVLGQFCADIRNARPPEPYKGKGIRYSDEYVRRKVGKAFTSGAM